MAAGWPTKVTYANGDVYSASDVNDTNGTLNYIDPSSATNNQVLTRDSAAPGKVKWANSPANTLTTTGDLYYASAANTPARLAIGSTDQILTVSGGVPTWATGGGGMTLLASGTLSGTFSLTGISGSYTDLVLRMYNTTGASFAAVSLTINSYTGATYSFANMPISGTPTPVGSATQASFGQIGYITNTTSTTLMDVRFPAYSSSTAFGRRVAGISQYNNGMGIYGGFVTGVTSAITSIQSSTSFTGGSYQLFGVK
jgi:hypothetical protein